MISALKETMPSGVRWTEPEGGLFIWLTCPESIDTDALFKEAAAARIAYIPGSKFYCADAGRKNEIRLNFSYASPSDIREGITRLAGILTRHIR
jgi:2-aminoadipate transaminase